MAFEFKDEVHRNKIIEMSEAVDKGDGCAVWSRLQAGGADQKMQVLQDLQQYRAGQTDSGKDLPSLEIIVSQTRGGSGGTTLSRKEGAMLELDWDARGRVQSLSCVTATGKTYFVQKSKS